MKPSLKSSFIGICVLPFPFAILAAESKYGISYLSRTLLIWVSKSSTITGSLHGPMISYGYPFLWTEGVTQSTPCDPRPLTSIAGISLAFFRSDTGSALLLLFFEHLPLSRQDNISYSTIV